MKSVLVKANKIAQATQKRNETAEQRSAYPLPQATSQIF